MKTFVCDTETLGGAPHGVIVSAAFIVFDLEKDYTFKELVKNALYIKFDVQEQKAAGRQIHKATLDWWKKQSKAAQVKLLPSKDDVSMAQGIANIHSYMNANGIYNGKDMFGFCRGMSFDFPLLVDLHEINNLQHMWLLDFWRQRDTRTYIGAALGNLSIDKVPLPASVFNPDDFVAHDPVCDIAKDILMMQYAQKYATGEVEFPQ